VGGTCSTHGVNEKCRQSLAGKAEGTTRRSRSSWEGIGIDLRELESMNLRVPQKAGNFLTSRVTVSVPRRNLIHGVCQFLSRCLSCRVLCV
jgi:hypothetical protein